MDAIDRAADFIHREARLLDRRRFEHHVGEEPAGGVVGALGAYANTPMAASATRLSRTCGPPRANPSR